MIRELYAEHGTHTEQPARAVQREYRKAIPFYVNTDIAGHSMHSTKFVNTGNGLSRPSLMTQLSIIIEMPGYSNRSHAYRLSTLQREKMAIVGNRYCHFVFARNGKTKNFVHSKHLVRLYVRKGKIHKGYFT